MQNKSNLATWLGVVLGTLMALALNATFAHAQNNETWCGEGGKYYHCGGYDIRVKEEFHKTYPLTATGRVHLENINGPAHISVWDRNEVKVDAVKGAQNDEQLKDAEILVDSQADSISIRTKYRERDWNYHYSDGRNSSAIVSYVITIPRKAQLDDVQLINGPLDVVGVQGEVRAQCINGTLTASGLGDHAKLSTVNGKLDVRFDQLPANSVELESVNGHIDLTLPSDAKATLEASTVHGGISNEFGLHTTHHFVGHDLHGTLGGGGINIRLSNVNGAIEIRHANDGRAMSPAKSESEGDQDEI